MTVGSSGKPMNKLVELAQHHWDNTEQIYYKMQEMLMYVQVSHYTGGAPRGCSGRGTNNRGRRDRNT